MSSEWWDEECRRFAETGVAMSARGERDGAQHGRRDADRV